MSPIPAGYHSVTPYLGIRGATAALDFYKRAFGAKERFRMEAPGGTIGHAEILVGNSVVMIADEMPQMGSSRPRPRRQPRIAARLRGGRRRVHRQGGA